MNIRFAEESDIETLSIYDKHIRVTELKSAVSLTWKKSMSYAKILIMERSCTVNRELFCHKELSLCGRVCFLQ